jgi:hypothetical protein
MLLWLKVYESSTTALANQYLEGQTSLNKRSMERDLFLVSSNRSNVHGHTQNSSVRNGVMQSPVTTIK